MKGDDLKREFASMYGPYFHYREFQCHCERCAAGRLGDVDHGGWFKKPEFKAFMANLIGLRIELGFPFQINSGYRCPNYNDSLYSGDGKHRDGPHVHGAADIGVAFERSYKLIALAMKHEMGVGPVQAGPVVDRFVHIDNRGPRLWTYI